MLVGATEYGGYLSPNEAASAYSLAKDFVIPSSYLYLSLEALPDAEALAAFMPMGLATFVLAHLDGLMRVVPTGIRQRTQGFEVWATCARPMSDDRIYLHIDCDEALRKATAEIRVPLLGSVLYLGPVAGLVGGETAVLLTDGPNEAFPPFQFHDWSTVAAQPAGVRVFTPTSGKLVLFDGSLIHGQGPVRAQPDGKPRVVLLVNLWDSRIGYVPDGICRVSAEIFRETAQAWQQNR